jgi:hypothetical protein
MESQEKLGLARGMGNTRKRQAIAGKRQATDA